MDNATENTGKRYTYKKKEVGAFIFRPDGSELCHVVSFAAAIEICNELNSYSTLKAENERLKSENEILTRVKEEIFSDFVDKKAENEEKEKRIKELEYLLKEAAFILEYAGLGDDEHNMSARFNEIQLRLENYLKRK